MVQEGAVAEVTVALEAMPSEEPYVQTYTMAGMSACDVSLFMAVFPLDFYTGSCPFAEPVRWVVQDVPASWRYGIVELTWNTNDAFALYTQNGHPNCLTSDPCMGIRFGGSAPLRLDMAPGDEELARQWASDGQTTYPEGEWELWANTLYIGMYRDEWGMVTDDTICRPPPVNYSPGCPSWGFSTGIRFDVYVSIFNWERPEEPEKYTGLPDA